jgi:hypothetical protein
MPEIISHTTRFSKPDRGLQVLVTTTKKRQCFLYSKEKTGYRTSTISLKPFPTNRIKATGIPRGFAARFHIFGPRCISIFITY